MNKNIFSELEPLGFNNLNHIKLFDNDEDVSQEKACENNVEKSSLYNKKIICPVCENKFLARAVKSNSYRVSKKDTDLFIVYALTNPYFYDVWVCNSCGYATLKVDFFKIREYQKKLILDNITSKWKGKTYPEEYDINIAIERYKLALLNYTAMEGKASQKSMTCLKIAWMYRMLEDDKNELLFLKEALTGFNQAYLNESFPIYGMNKPTMMYLIGELNRRTGNDSEALLWLGKVITTPGVSSKLKNLARDQKDLIKETQLKKEISIATSNTTKLKPTKKKSFWAKLFNL